ncbi:MAG: hypothetical protein AB1585_02705 [Thermodesulfobacteriota bacterium]
MKIAVLFGGTSSERDVSVASGGAQEIFPADLPEEKILAVQELALRAQKALKVQDYSRVDFRMDAQGNFWCLEVNTLPGMTHGKFVLNKISLIGQGASVFC